MSLPHRQNRDDDEWPVPHLPIRRPVESEKAGVRNSRTAEVAKPSRLSAQMVELSLQKAQREPTLHGPLPAKLNAQPDPILHDPLPAELNAAKPKEVSSPLPPLPWPSTIAAPPQLPQTRATPRESKVSKYWKPSYWKPDYWKKVRGKLDHWLAAARVWFAGAIVSGSAAVRSLARNLVRHLYEHAKSAQRKFAVSNFRTNFRTDFRIKTRYGTASRLWTSTGVAALSAVLVVGVISGVRHYGHTPDTSQPRGQNTSPVTPAMQDISQPRPSSIVNTNGAAVTQHPATSSAPKPAPTKQGTRKVHRTSKDDDYVAKDTFVSYGKNGKPAR